MWPVGRLSFRLAGSFQASEDEHFFELRCTRCGWTATFSATGVKPEEIVAAALGHQCPTPAPRRCGRCGVEVGEDRASCPNCGEWLLPT